MMHKNIKSLVVQDVIIEPDNFPVVNEEELLRQTIEKMNKFKLGIACIVNSKNMLLAVITDGDIRRILLSEQKPIASLFVDDVIDHASLNFKYVKPNTLLNDAISMMGNDKIWDLPVIDEKGFLVGLLHLHPAIKKVFEVQ